MNCKMDAVTSHLKEKNVYQIPEYEVSELLTNYSVEQEFETGITGPIKILRTNDKEKKLILEIDQKGHNFIRFVDIQDIKEFVDERLSIYDKMWDGCGCKVFYNEEWISGKKVKKIEI